MDFVDNNQKQMDDQSDEKMVQSDETEVSSGNAIEDPMQKETDFFKFHPFTFLDDLSEVTHDYCADSADFIESCLIGHPLFKNELELQNDIKEGTNKVWELIDDSFTRNLMKFEEFVLANILNVPSDIVIPSQEEGESSIAKEITALEPTANIYPTTPSSTPNSKRNKKKQQQQQQAQSNNPIVNRSKMLDKEIDDLRNAITKINLENNELKKKTNQITNELKLLNEIDSSLLSKNLNEKIDSRIIPSLESVHRSKKTIQTNYETLKNSVNDQYLQQSQSSSSGASLIERMTNLTIDIKDDVKSLTSLQKVLK